MEGIVIKSLEHEEEILRPSLSRYVMFPIQYPEIWALYKKQVDL